MNKLQTFETGIKKILILLLLLILSPLITSLGVKAFRVFKEYPKNMIAYGLVIIGICMILYTVYFGLKTFKTILDIMFRN